MANVYDLIDNMFDNAELSEESYYPTISTEGMDTLPWHASKKNTKKEPVQKIFSLDTTDTFRKDWKAATTKDFNNKDEIFKKLSKELKELVNNGYAHPHSNKSKKNARKMEYQLSSSKIGKSHDSRVFYAIFNKVSSIYLLSIASPADHHKDQKDLKAVSRADAKIDTLRNNERGNPL